MSTHRMLTQAELVAEARALFGDDPLTYAFQCPNCDDVASIKDFVEAGSPDRAGQECIGRVLGAGSGRGCNWAAYGLISGPWEVIMPAEGDKPQRSAWSFPLAKAAVTA